MDLGPPAETLPQLFGSRTVVVQWGMSPVIDATELRLLRIAYRRAHGSPEMPGADFISELTQELKDQAATNTDLRDESELFFEYHSRQHSDYPSLDANVVTTNDDDVCQKLPQTPGAVSPLARNVCRRIDVILHELAQINAGWFRIGGKWDVPRGACYVGRYKDRYVWVEPDGLEALTDFTLTVLKISSLVKETQTLVSPGSVKFSPGDR